MQETGCTAKDLAELSGLSAATVSRYRSGERTPAAGSSRLTRLGNAFAALAERKGISGIDSAAVQRDLRSACSENDRGFDAASFHFNFSLMTETLSLNLSDMARTMGYDTSYLSRIGAGKRTPADPERFVQEAVTYALKARGGSEYQAKLAGLLGCREKDIADKKSAYDRLYGFLYSDSESPRRYAESFLCTMNSFNIDEYLKENSRYDLSGAGDRGNVAGEIPEMTYDLAHVPFIVQGFIRRTIPEHPDAPLTICWNIPDKPYGENGEVDLRLTETVARMMASGARIRLIHCGANSVEDMTAWMTQWMPLYLTGRIDPYYLEGGSGRIFHSAFFLSGNGVLQIEEIEGHADRGRIVFSEAKDDLIYYSRRAEDLISHSEKALEVISSADREKRDGFLMQDADVTGKRKTLLSTPPTYTASPELMKTLFDRNGTGESDRRRILDYIDRERGRILKIMEHSEQEDHIPYITRKDYAKNPIHLSLSGLFYEKDIFYTYEEYMKHVEDTRRFERENRRYRVILREGMPYRNIQIFMHSGKWVMISKNKTPAVHFIIRHPGLIDSLEKMIEIYTRNG